MAWSAPPTAAANLVFTASQWNSGVRDNLQETALAKASTTSRLIVTDAANSVQEREIAEDFVLASQTVTNTVYSDPATPGPQVIVTCGFQALVWMSCNLSTTAGTVLASFGVNGVAAVDARAILQEGLVNKDDRYGVTNLFGSIAPGAWTFLMRYRSTAGTLTCGARRLIVMAL